MDIRQLKYFIAIFEEPSLPAAAQRLRVAHPEHLCLWRDWPGWT
jgi:DNA-binding transcriptional LysR family regulator